MTKHYACIALDVMKSRHQNLKEVEQSLLSLKKLINQQFEQHLAIPFTIRKGDELIGVVKRFSDAYRIIRLIEKEVENDKNITFYIGCGFGRIDTMNKEDIDIANGSSIINALHARDEIIKKGDRQAKIWELKHYNKTFFYTEDFPYQSLNSIFYFISELILKRSQKQKEVVNVVEENPDLTYEEIGKRFEYKSPKTSISNHLYAANYELVKETEKSLINLLNYHQDILEQSNE